MPAIRVDLAQERGAPSASSRTGPPDLQQSLPDRRNHASRDAVLRRVRGEFEEMQGLQLTFAQARRLFGLREDICLRVLNTLIAERLLWVTPDTLYARRFNRP